MLIGALVMVGFTVGKGKWSRGRAGGVAEYRERVAVGRGDESSSSPCKEKAGSFHSSLLLTSTGFGAWEVGAQALSHSSSH